MTKCRKIVAILAALFFTGIASAQVTEEAKWQNGQVSLAGTLYLPEGDGPFPAVVILHGSGTLPRTDRLYREHGERLSKAGISVLVYDKRGVGGSTGDWKTADLNDLAADAEQGVKVLRSHKKVDPKRIGALGISQGAWVAVILASRTPIAFIVWLSGTPVTPAEQGHFIIESTLRQKKYEPAAISKAAEIDRLVTNVYRTDSGWDEAAKRIEEVKDEHWFKDAGLGLQPKDSWNWKWYGRLLDYDPLPEMKKQSMPTLAVYGEQDPIIPIRKSILILDDLRLKEKRDVTTVVIPGVGHDFSIRRGPSPEKYWQEIAVWLGNKTRLSK